MGGIASREIHVRQPVTFNDVLCQQCLGPCTRVVCSTLSNRYNPYHVPAVRSADTDNSAE